MNHFHYFTNDVMGGSDGLMEIINNGNDNLRPKKRNTKNPYLERIRRNFVIKVASRHPGLMYTNFGVIVAQLSQSCDRHQKNDL